MSILNIFKKEEEEKKKKASSATKVTTKQEKSVSDKKGKKVAVAKKSAESKKNAKTKVRVGGNAYKVLVRPLITEKAADLGALNQYVFEVYKDANKIEIKKAIKDIYGVVPVKVRIVSVGGKSRKFGRVMGKTKSWKKAIVTLKQGEKIEIYEGV